MALASIYVTFSELRYSNDVEAEPFQWLELFVNVLWEYQHDWKPMSSTPTAPKRRGPESFCRSPLCTAAALGRPELFHWVSDTPRALSKAQKDRTNAPDRSGMTPLTWAAYNDHENVVKLLLQYSVINVNHMTKSGSTVLMIAAQRNAVGVMELLGEDGRAAVSGVSPVGPTIEDVD